MANITKYHKCSLTHVSFMHRQVHNETSKLREEMLKNLALASDGFNELHSHLVEGNKFYNDLTEILLKFQNKVSDFVFARKTEKDDLMKDIQTNISRPSSAAAAAPARPPPPVPATDQRWVIEQLAIEN